MSDDDDDSDFSGRVSSRKGSKQSRTDDIGLFVRKVINSKLVEKGESDAFNQMIIATQAIMPDLQLYLVETSSSPDIQAVFSQVQDVVASLKALAMIQTNVGIDANPESYEMPEYGNFRLTEEYKPGTVTADPLPVIAEAYRRSTAEDDGSFVLGEAYNTEPNPDHNPDTDLEKDLSEEDL